MVSVPDSFVPENCLKAMTAIEDDLTHLTASLTEAEFHAPTRSGGWSVAYCVEHLVLTGQSLLPLWDATLKLAVEQKRYSQGPFPYPWWQRGILRLVQPPYRLKTKTLRTFTPCSRRTTEEELRRFLRMHKQLAGRIETSRGIDALGISVQSPIASWIQYPLGFSFDFALAHERRHLWQAWQVRRQLPSAEFPDQRSLAIPEEGSIL